MLEFDTLLQLQRTNISADVTRRNTAAKTWGFLPDDPRRPASAPLSFKVYGRKEENSFKSSL